MTRCAYLASGLTVSVRTSFVRCRIIATLIDQKTKRARTNLLTKTTTRPRHWAVSTEVDMETLEPAQPEAERGSRVAICPGAEADIRIGKHSFTRMGRS